MKVNVTTFVIWSDLVHEYSRNHKVDLVTSASDIAKRIEAFRTLQDVHRAIGNEERRLSILAKLNGQKETAVNLLIKLREAGYTRKGIVESLTRLTGMISGGRLDEELIVNGGFPRRRPGQPKVAANINEEQPPDNNGYGGGVISANDLIRLNMLKVPGLKSYLSLTKVSDGGFKPLP